MESHGSLTVTRGRLGYPETIDHLLESITRRGLTVFARIDHAGGARQAGMQLPAEEVVLLGSPRAGTPLMQSDPKVGIELPLRILLWQEGEDVFLGYRDPRLLAHEYDVASHQSTAGFDGRAPGSAGGRSGRLTRAPTPARAVAPS